MLTFEKIPSEDLNMIGLIVDRAKSASRDTNSTIDKARRSELVVVLTACHLAFPLRLDDLHKAPDFDLLHDIHGIYVNYGEGSGKNIGRFVPRYSVRLSAEQEAEMLGQYLIEVLCLEAKKNRRVDIRWGGNGALSLGLFVKRIVAEKLYLETSK